MIGERYKLQIQSHQLRCEEEPSTGLSQEGLIPDEICSGYLSTAGARLGFLPVTTVSPRCVAFVKHHPQFGFSTNQDVLLLAC